MGRSPSDHSYDLRGRGCRRIVVICRLTDLLLSPWCGSARPFYVVCVTNTATGRSVFGRASEFEIAQKTAWSTMAELEAIVPAARRAPDDSIGADEE